MPKVLFIGHFRENSGWGKAGRGYIHALKAAGFEVAARAVKLSNENIRVDEVVSQAEETVSNGAEYCIQHLLPHHMEYSGLFRKCVGIADIDSINLEHTGWLSRFRLMDEVWVPNTKSAESLRCETDMPTIRVAPHAFDTSVYSKQYGKIDLQVPDNTYKFYTIATAERRKNLGAIIRAFHLAFPTDKNVALIIKVHRSGMSEDDLFEQINNFTIGIKKGMRLYPNIEDYHNEIVITNKSSEEAVYALHQSCNCYVTSSFNEAWCIPAFEAMAFGNRVISNDVGGPFDYLHGGHALVSNREEPVFEVDNSFDNLFTSRESWYSVDVNSLAKAMQWAYSERNIPENTLDEYSYESVGNRLKQMLQSET